MRAASGAALASVAAAAASSACCWLPLTAVSLGLGVGGLGALFEHHRWLLLGASVLLLALGWFLNERGTVDCAPDGTCPPPQARLRRFNRIVLVASAMGVAFFALLPELLGTMASRPTTREIAAQRPAQRLGAGAPELRDAFNRDHGSVRLLVLLAPT